MFSVQNCVAKVRVYTRAQIRKGVVQPWEAKNARVAAEGSATVIHAENDRLLLLTSNHLFSGVPLDSNPAVRVMLGSKGIINEPGFVYCTYLRFDSMYARNYIPVDDVALLGIDSRFAHEWKDHDLAAVELPPSNFECTAVDVVYSWGFPGNRLRGERCRVDKIGGQLVQTCDYIPDGASGGPMLFWDTLIGLNSYEHQRSGVSERSPYYTMENRDSVHLFFGASYPLIRRKLKEWGADDGTPAWIRSAIDNILNKGQSAC